MRTPWAGVFLNVCGCDLEPLDLGERIFRGSVFHYPDSIGPWQIMYLSPIVGILLVPRCICSARNLVIQAGVIYGLSSASCGLNIHL